ncbi:restriction endonuclease subunit S [uncultured Gemmiger sp.]|uniref:restriction endonuclease subunit S n=1 Tax=uncultured Gemmiger sp. TaxID=1623490 RepID=UPI00266BA58B|nr:restriction endonuclease subunit S [uncultured Gemmiger sp.]
MMEICKLSNIAKFTTGKLNSNAAEAGGNYPFFTCSPEPLRINTYAFNTEAIILAGNNAEGNFHIQYYEGKFNAYQRTYVIESCDASRVNLRYLYYALKMCLHHFKQISQGTATKFLTAKILNGFELPIPTIEKQNKIASLLGNLDKKIESNEIINKNLEQQAQAYFNELFVVNAVPTWSECTLSDIGTIVAGGTPSKSKPEYYAKQGIAWITPKDLAVDKSKFISRGANDISELGFSKSSATKMPAGTVLFSSRAPIGYIAIAQNEVTTNQGFKSVVPNENIGTAYVYFLLKNLLPTIEGMASGSTFKEISGTGMKSVPTIMPDMSTIQRFNIFCEPIFKEQEVLEAENHRLSILRDSLLPKLMSGELDISDIDL